MIFQFNFLVSVTTCCTLSLIVLLLYYFLWEMYRTVSFQNYDVPFLDWTPLISILLLFTFLYSLFWSTIFFLVYLFTKINFNEPIYLMKQFLKRSKKGRNFMKIGLRWLNFLSWPILIAPEDVRESPIFALLKI